MSRKGFHVERASTGSDALIALSSSNPQLILLDAASLRSSGRRICQSLIKQAPGIPIVIIFGPDTPPDEKTGANVTLQLPFTLQKLLNRIRGLMPVEEKDAIQVGEMQLDVEHRWVRVGSRQVRLTPRLVVLLKILMDRAGEVIERKELFSQVWDTDYTDDTRTLDVHISWLRQALEEDPR
ncbi:response regulator transcription factor, partial [Levilinea saccharolytica]